MVTPSIRHPGTRLITWSAPLTILAALVLPACAYVGPSAIEAKIDTLDHDGDGYPYGGPNRDCNDFDARESPGNEEIPYDGLDNDCVDGDLLDVDGDGFAGVSKTWYLEQFPDAKWPDGLPDAVDCIDDPAIHPRARDIYPGADDIPYDGIDSDCAGDNDFDLDGDGYMPDTFEFDGAVHDTRAAYEAYVQEWGYTHLPTPVFGDCDDFRASVNPGVPPEDDLWYDGIDSDCSGNNDFDQDGDGFMPNWDQLPLAVRSQVTEAAYLANYNSFIQQFHDGQAPWDEDWGDCLDEARPELDVAPEEVYPGAVDVPYDGIDADCAEDNDFDNDGDGVIPDTFGPDDEPTLPAFEDYVTTWGYEHLNDTAVFGDCNDDDPNIRPGALEYFFDPQDMDCDGDPATTPWAFADYHWDQPMRPRILGTDTHYLITTSSPGVDFNLGSVLENTGTLMTFPRPDASGNGGVGYMPFPGRRLLWQAHTGNPVHLAMDMASDGEDTIYVASTFTLGPNTVLTQQPIHYDPNIEDYTANVTLRDYAGSTIRYTGTDVDVLIDDLGTAWSLSCDETTFHVQQGGFANLSGLRHGLRGNLPIGCDEVEPPACTTWGPPGDICFFQDAPDTSDGTYGSVLVNLCVAEEGCTTYKYTPNPGLSQPADRLVVTADQPWASLSLTEADYHNGWHLITRTEGGATVRTPDNTQAFHVFEDYSLRSFSAVEKDETSWYFAAIVDVEVEVDGEPVLQPQVLLGWGDPSETDAFGNVSLQTKFIPFYDPNRPNLILNGVSVYADADRLALVASASNPDLAGDDAVGWLFMGW